MWACGVPRDRVSLCRDTDYINATTTASHIPKEEIGRLDARHTSTRHVDVDGGSEPRAVGEGNAQGACVAIFAYLSLRLTAIMSDSKMNNSKTRLLSEGSDAPPTDDDASLLTSTCVSECRSLPTLGLSHTTASSSPSPLKSTRNVSSRTPSGLCVRERVNGASGHQCACLQDTVRDPGDH